MGDTKKEARLVFACGLLGWTMAGLTVGTAIARAGHPSEYRPPVELQEQIPRKWRKVMEAGLTTVLARDVRISMQGIDTSSSAEGRSQRLPFTLEIPVGTRIRPILEGYGRGVGVGKISTRQLEFTPCVTVDYPAAAVNSASSWAADQKIRIILPPPAEDLTRVCSLRIEFTELGESLNPEITDFLDSLKLPQIQEHPGRSAPWGGVLKSPMPAPPASKRADDEPTAPSGRRTE